MAPVKPNKVDKRTKMLIRRVRKLQEGNNTLKEQHDEILSKFIEQSRINSDLEVKNRQLVKDILDLTFTNNHLKGIIRTVDNNVVNCLKPLGELSSSMLNAKRLLGDNNELLYANKAESSGKSYVSPGGSSSSTRAQALVNPMVKGYVIQHPIVSLSRYRTSEELHSMRKEIKTTRALFSENDGLSPIPEDPPSSGGPRRRGKMGRRRHTSTNVYSPGQIDESRLEATTDNVLDCNLVPMVRLRDVSRLIQNSSVVILNQGDTDDDILNVSSRDCESRSSTFENRISNQINNSEINISNENEPGPSMIISDLNATTRKSQLTSVVPSSGSSFSSPSSDSPSSPSSGSPSSGSVFSPSDIKFSPSPCFTPRVTVKRRKALIPEDYTPKIKSVKKKRLTKVKKEPISRNASNESLINDQTLEPEVTMKKNLKTETSAQGNNEPSQATTSNLVLRPRRNLKALNYKEDLRTKKRRSRSVKL